MKDLAEGARAALDRQSETGGAGYAWSDEGSIGRWGPGGEERGCLELLVLLPFLGMVYYIYQIISSI